MKKDIENREDIILMVNTFYDKVKQNPLLDQVFDELMQVNWDEHLPKMYNFWEMIIFSGKEYQGNPMREHLKINEIQRITPKHFEEWLAMFFDTVDELFEGKIAEDTKKNAYNIANTWNYKIEFLNQQNDEHKANLN